MITSVLKDEFIDIFAVKNKFYYSVSYYYYSKSDAGNNVLKY
jgi:hypothetical protein